MTALDIVKRFYPNVTTVKDASRPLTVRVTEADVRASKKKDHSGCAVAKACLRFKPVDGAIVSVSTAYLIKGNSAIRYKVPQAVAREIISFDRAAVFSPGEYTLNSPASFNKLGATSATGSNNRSGTGKARGFNHVSHGIRKSLAVSKR